MANRNLLSISLKIAISLFFLGLLTSVSKASEFKFALQRSTEWQFVGRKVQFNFTIAVAESTPLKVKIRLPFNRTAILRITEATYTLDSLCLTSTNNTTTLTSSASDSLYDIAMFDFGEVTRASCDNSTVIKIDFEIQVMNHAHIINGGAQWVSVGAEYKNQSVWAAQVAVQTINPSSSRPDLKVEVWPDLGDQSVVTNDMVDLRIRLSHSDLTTEEAVSGMITWPLPPMLLLKGCVKDARSIEVSVSNTPDMITMKFGQLNFSDTVDLKCTFSFDKSKTKRDGKIHDCTTHIDVKYNGSINSCSSVSGSNEFTNEEPATTHFKFYVKQSYCDEALGMQDGRIKPYQITASSYAASAQPHEGRMGGKAWIPHGDLAKERHQFLEVNFLRKVQIRRISTKGAGRSFVKRFQLFYSDDGALWTPYKQGSKIMEFAANVNGNSVTQIILPLPLKAVFVRINPVNWENSIALQVEFYGCNSSDSHIPSKLNFTSHGYLLDTTGKIMYVCSISMESKMESSKCFFSKDQGDSWTSMYYGVVSLLGHDAAENVLYGVSLNGRAVMKSTKDHAAKFVGIPLSTWLEVKAKDNTTHAVHIRKNDSAIADHTINPTRIKNTKWGVSAKGIHFEKSSSWSLKAIWMCNV